MAAHKKFNFDDPEDSYWNANGPSTSGLFDDPPSTNNAAAARAALEDLFESQVRFASDDASSAADGDMPLEASAQPSPSLLSATTLFQGNKKPITGDNAYDRQLQKQMSLDNAASQSNRKFSEIGRGLSIKSTASVVSEGSAGSFSNDSAAQLDYTRIKSEHRRLQRHLEQVRRERYKAADPEITVRRLQNSEPVALDLYRSKKEKLELLDSALDSLDGNAIIAVVLFLKRTLTESLFRSILLRKTVAANHYVAYLKLVDDQEQLATTLFALGRNEEAGMAEFSVACRQRSPELKVQSLKRCLVSGFSSPALVGEAKLVNEYIDLLERQIPIDAADESTIKVGGNEMFMKFSKVASLIGQPLHTTLYYCCLYHFDLPPNSFASPLSIKEVFQLNEKQFVWTAVSALSRLARWPDVERLLTSKKLLGGNKIVCPFSWYHLFRLINAYDAPPKDLLCKLLRAVPDVEERKRLAEQFPDGANVAIECCVVQKDRLGLNSLISKLTPHTLDAYKAQAALNSAVLVYNLCS